MPRHAFATINPLKRPIAITLAIVIGIAAGLGGAVYIEPRLPRYPLVAGLRIGGQVAPPQGSAFNWLRERELTLRQQRVTLRHGEHAFEATFADLGISIDAAATVAAAERVGHEGSVFKRWNEAAEARRGAIDVPLIYRFDDTRARGYLTTIAPQLVVEPVDAELDLVNHQKITDKPGRKLDVEASVSEIAASYAAVLASFDSAEPQSLSIIAAPVPAKVTLTDLGDVDITKVLATFDTRYSVYKKGRSANVELATKRLNGLILRPGRVMSFNDRVGPRTRERGFHQAPEIVGDELTIGIGGGTCQVSTTFYGAALYGGMEIVQRKSHSRPSSYTKLGLDATVAYPSVDLKLRNPFNFTLVVHAYIPEPGKLRVELLGGEAVRDVKYSYGVSSIEEYVRRITVKRHLKPGRRFRKQKGTRGMDVHSTVIIHFNDGSTQTKRYYSGYRATPEVFWVAPDVDTGELPPLPAHAKGVEGKLAEDGTDVYPTAG